MGSARPALQQRTAQTPAGTPPDQPVNPDVKWALDNRKKKAPEYQMYRGYYDGTGQLAMITDKQRRTVFGQMFQYFNANHCAPVVDAPADRLQIASFSAPEEEEHQREVDSAKREMEKRERERKQAQEQGLPAPETPAATDEPAPESKIKELEQNIEGVPSASEEAQAVWDDNLMDLQIGQVFEEALSTGNGYILVWPNEMDADDPDTTPVIMYPQAAHEVYVDYDSDKPGKITKAAKLWSEQVDVGGGKKDGYRINLYYPDRIEKFAATGQGKEKRWPEAKNFVPYDDGSGQRIPNGWGMVPIFHFANKRRLGLNQPGVSELRNAIKIQDAQNRELWRLLIAGEFDVLKQKYVVNVSDPSDPANMNGTPDARPLSAGASGVAGLRSGPDQIMAFKGTGEEGETPQVGEFSSADMQGFQIRVNVWRETMAIATGTPVQYFMPTQEGPATPASGESQKIADTKLDKKVRDRQIAWGAVIKSMMELAVRMSRGEGGTEVELKVNWEDTRPRNELESWQKAILQGQAGVPWQIVMKEQGYTDDQIEMMEHLKEQNAAKFNQAPVAGGLGPQGKDVEQVAKQQTAERAANDAAKQAAEDAVKQGSGQQARSGTPAGR